MQRWGEVRAWLAVSGGIESDGKGDVSGAQLGSDGWNWGWEAGISLWGKA